MKIILNETAWETRPVRRVLQATARAFVKRELPLGGVWWALRVKLSQGRSQNVRVAWDGSDLLYVTLPPLTGDEFIALARQMHGGAQSEQAVGLAAERLALALQPVLYAMKDMRVPDWARHHLMAGNQLRRIPEFLPIRIKKPKPPRDKLRDKLTRTVELEKRWRTKAKLAATKLKKLGRDRKRYEKQIAQRQEA